MNVLNEEYSKKLKELNAKCNLTLTDYECECYSNMFHVLNEVVNNKLTLEQLMDTYIFFLDVLNGKKPNIDLFTYEDAFKGFYRLSKRYSTTKNLEEKERTLFCFVIFWASCITTMNKETGESTWNMKHFEQGVKPIIKEYEFELKQFPERFIIKNYSDPSKKDYGYTTENPIELTSVSELYDYLNSIETEKGEKIKYKRIGVFEGEDGILIDGYNIYVKGFIKYKKITTLYLTGEGFSSSIYTPKGFKFI